MNTNTSVGRLERKIAAIKRNLLELGPMHPGNVSQQFQVCGRPACRCAHPTKPERHGPYYKLAYVYRGKPVCRFVRAACVEDVKDRVAVYKQFRSMMDSWIKLSIQRGVIEFFTPVTTTKPKVRKARSA